MPCSHKYGEITLAARAIAHLAPSFAFAPTPLAQVPGIVPDVQDAFGKTALHVACHLGDEAAVNLLLGLDASSNLQDVDGWTSAHYAASGGHARVIQQLWKPTTPGARSVNILIRDSWGCVAVDVAERNGHIEVVQVLRGHEKAATSRERWKKVQRGVTYIQHGVNSIECSMNADDLPPEYPEL